MKMTSFGTPSVPWPENEDLGVNTNIVYGLQHVLTMRGGIVVVPLILDRAAGLAPGGIDPLIATLLSVGDLAALL